MPGTSDRRENAMDFKQFRYFIAVADALHMGRAAELLGVAQPALSQQIKALEQRLRTQLFSRDNRRLTITAAGRIFLEEARIAVRQADHALQMGMKAGRGEIGRIVIGYVDSAMLGSTLRTVLANFQNSRPEVEVGLIAMNVVDQINDLMEEKLDIAIVRGPLPLMPPFLSADLFQREPMAVAIPEAHPLASLRSLTLELLRDEKFITPKDPVGIGLAGHISRLCESVGFVPRVSIQVASTQTMVALVDAGFGVSILPVSLDRVRIPGVTFRPFTQEVSTELFTIRRARERRPDVLGFLKVCQMITHQ
jgi:DNA-binding transcriptional LysR family regulator